MKRFFALILTAVLVLSFVACGNSKQVDFENEIDFEVALNNGDDVTGKTVSISVNNLIPDSAFGYNIQTGEHLNFCSSTNPNVKAGDVITVRVVEVTSMLGSYIVKYEKVK